MTINVIEIQVPGTPGAIGVDWRGNWVNGQTYNPRDGVYDQYGSWRCLVAHTASAANRPVSGVDFATYWFPIAYLGDSLGPAVETVAENIESVNTDAANIASINTVAAVPNINTLGANAAGLVTIITNMTEILNADNQAVAAANSAAAALASQNAAAASATTATNKATATSNDRAQTAADVIATQAARDSALAAYDSFDDRYLGPKASNPTLDNDGNALVAGTLYYNTTVPEMRLYTGSAWVAAYVSGGSYALIANNGSDYTAATFRTNLSLYSIAQVDGFLAAKAALAGAAFTGPVSVPASIAGAAGFSIPAGVAPTTPADGNIWTIAASFGLFARINGASLQVAWVNGANTYTARQIFAASTTSNPSIRITPGVDPSASNNGDVWTTSTVLKYYLNGSIFTSMTLEGTQTVTGAITFNTMPTLPANGVTLAKIAQGTALSVLGITGNAAANYADMVAGTDGHVLRRSGTTLGFGQIVAAGIANGVLNFAHFISSALATGSNYWTMAANKFITTDSLVSAMAEQTLTDAATIAWDMSLGVDWTVTLAGNRTLGNPTNCIVGRRGRIRVVQDATGTRTLTKSSNHKTAGGAALLLSTAAGAVDYIDYDCRSATDIRLSTTRAWS